MVLLHKGSDKHDINNYRPISLLPLPGKLLESIIYTRLYLLLELNHILTDKQSGFRSARSTIDAGSNLIDSILHGLNSKNHVGVLYSDLQKAFDSINHDVLLQKLEMYGVREIELRWFRSYLSDRQQSILVNNVTSEYRFLSHGVSQGSCLGPLLFLVYINDIASYLPEYCINL